MEKEAQKELHRHFSHKQHPLIYKKLSQIRPKQDHHHDDHHDNGGDGDGDGDGASYNPGLLNHICKGCDEQISLYDDPYCYRCDECDYDLHKLCAEAPLTIQHPLHEEHPLKLRNGTVHGRTNCCQFQWTGFYYYCRTCYFKVDVICATAGQRKVYSPHHNHLLSLFHKPLFAQCNACGIRNEALFFQCTTCLVFWLHKDCALLSKQILIQEANKGEDKYHHNHPLIIAHGLIQSHAKHSPSCRICKAGINRNLWIYSCERCRYFVHIDCTMTPRKKVHGSSTPEDGHLVLKLPLGDEFQSLMERLLSKCDFALNANISLVHDHSLILYDRQDGERDDKNIAPETRACIPLHNPMKRIKLLCNACVMLIVEIPFYRCGEQQCNEFFLHKRCVELPNELLNRIFHDQHPLTLIPNVPEFFGIFRCELCNLPSNGFAYGCVKCRYYVDVRCALVPLSIKHEAHPEHVLHFRECEVVGRRGKPPCHGCRRNVYVWMFQCDECKFKLCSDCAQSPKTMRHKYDHHPLELMYSPPEDHISQYFCDICEEEKEMDPNKWFYHCAECDQQMHAHCSGMRFGFKCGGSITIDLHPHPLTFAEWRTVSNITCNQCNKSISFGFRCVKCKYTLHYGCAFKAKVLDPGITG